MGGGCRTEVDEHVQRGLEVIEVYRAGYLEAEFTDTLRVLCHYDTT